MSTQDTQVWVWAFRLGWLHYSSRCIPFTAKCKVKQISLFIITNIVYRISKLSSLLVIVSLQGLAWCQVTYSYCSHTHHLITYILGRPPFSTILEYRGKSFSVGGDPGEYTLPNFLSTYADELKGSPEGITLPLSRGKDLNNAVRINIKKREYMVC